MSLTSSLFTGTSGLKNMGNGMQVVGNNIANTNTLGFKGGRSTFADTLYETVGTQAGTAQMGRGMAVGSVTNNFNQGSFESTGNATDMSIGGDGFFIVRQQGTDNTYYTRAGNFHFDATGKLISQEGHVVQGWILDPETGDNQGAITDLILDKFTSSPLASSSIVSINNLNADAEIDHKVLSSVWNASDPTKNYIGRSAYEHPALVSVYDSLGSSHDLTIYYDKKSDTEWQYIVTSNPEEDKRNLVQDSDAKGLLARGTITFSESSGAIVDLTMEKFTGRLGNFKSDGVNSVENVKYDIQDYEAIPVDGYGFELEFDGTQWNFVDVNGDNIINADDKPANYANATILSSDGTGVRLAFDGKTDVDLEIRLTEAAVAGDSIGFDINAQKDLHKQDIDPAVTIESPPRDKDGEYISNNSSNLPGNDDFDTIINDPGAMTHDSSVGIVWSTENQQWVWSNPEKAYSAGTLVSGVTLQGSAQTASTLISVTNAADFDMVSSDVQLRREGRTGEWDWNMPLKDDDFSDLTIDGPGGTGNNITVAIEQPPGTAVASMSAAGAPTTISLFWDGAAWVASNGGGQTVVTITSSGNDSVKFTLYEGSYTAGGESTATLNLTSQLSTAGGESITFQIDPTPPEEYARAVITTSATAATGFDIDLDNDKVVDMEINVTAGGTVIAANDLFQFDVDPNVPPDHYSNATLTGDNTKAVIDLDGSGGESDDDIQIDFSVKLIGSDNTHPLGDRTKITFGILGSTAWEEVKTSDVSSNGLFQFTTDFLGGAFGSTEQEIEMNLGSSYINNAWTNDSLSTTRYAKASSNTYRDSDGYAAGDLESVSVSKDGTITGNYSNGQLLPLFRVGLAKFYNNFGLHAEGGNLYSQTNDSGEAITNAPGENGLGNIAPNSLEMSNVDISDQLVKMIEIQRGYQGNSKTITTVDEMLQTVINMK